MRSRALAILVAVIVPLAALGLVVAQRGDSSHKPARLPILSGGGAENATLGAARADIAMYPYGGIVYKAAANLPALDGSARAYKISAADAGALRQLADALGFAGIDADNAGTFTKGDEQLSVSRFGYWGYSRGFSMSVSSSGVAAACAPNADCRPPETTIPQHPVDLPPEADAKATAVELLRLAGIDTDHATVTVDDLVTQWNVRFAQAVDGLATEGLTTMVTVGEKSTIDFASGILGRPEPVDEYPLIGTRAAIDNLNSGKGFLGPMPMMAADTPTAGRATGEAEIVSPSPDANTASAAEPPQPATAPAQPPTEPVPVPTLSPCDGSGAPTTFACAPIDTIAPPPPQEITLIGAERVLLFAQSFTGDESWLVPAYRFATSDGIGPTVLAIDDSFLLPPPGADTGGSVDSGSGGGRTGSGGVEPQPAPDPKSVPSGPPDTIEPGK